jgi:hypothetical protein
MNLIHPITGEYNIQAIADLATANTLAMKKIYGDLFSALDVEVALNNAWNRAHAEKTRWNFQNGHYHELSHYTAAELARD